MKQDLMVLRIPELTELKRGILFWPEADSLTTLIILLLRIMKTAPLKLNPDNQEVEVIDCATSLKSLRNFMKSLDYIKMKPVNNALIRLTDVSNLTIRGLAENDDVIALYLHRKDTTGGASVMDIELSAGSYNLIWTDTKKGTQRVASMTSKKGGWVKITTPSYKEDLALKILKSD